MAATGRAATRRAGGGDEGGDGGDEFCEPATRRARDGDELRVPATAAGKATSTW